MSTLTGPIIEPQSNEKPKQLIIFCHGYGADGNDLIGLSSYFQNVFRAYQRAETTYCRSTYW